MQIFPHIQTEKYEAVKSKQAKNSPNDMFSLLLGKVTTGNSVKKSSENKTGNTFGVFFTKENFSRLAKQDMPKETAEKITKSSLDKNMVPIEAAKTNKTKQEKDEKIAFAASLYMQLLAELQVKTDKKPTLKTEIKTEQPKISVIKHSKFKYSAFNNEQQKVSGIKLQTAILTELQNFLQEAGISKDEIKKLTDKLQTDKPQADKNTLAYSFSVNFLREKITKTLLKTVQDFTQKASEAVDISSKQNQKLVLPKIASQIKDEIKKKTADGNVKTNLKIDAKTAKNVKIAPKAKIQIQTNLQKIEQNEKVKTVHNSVNFKTVADKQEKTEKLFLQFESSLNRVFQSLGMNEKDSKKLSREILSDVQEIHSISEKQTNESLKVANFVKINDNIILEKKQKTDNLPESITKTALKSEKIASHGNFNEKQMVLDEKQIIRKEKQALLDKKQIIQNEKQAISSEKSATTEQKNPEIIIENQEKTEIVKDTFTAAKFVEKQMGKKISDQDTKNRSLENKTAKTEKAEIGETIQAKMSSEEQNEPGFKQENSSADHKTNLYSVETNGTATAKTSGKSEQFRLPTVAYQIEQAVFKNIRPGSQRLVLHLNPAELGSVMISLRVTQDKEVQAVLRAASPEAAQAISEQAGQLRQMLENQGFKVSRFDVEHNSSFQSDLNFANRQNNPQNDSQKGFEEQFAWQSNKNKTQNITAVPNNNEMTNLEHELQNTLQKEKNSSGVDLFA